MTDPATKAVSLPIVAWTALTQAGQIGYFDGRPMVMPGPVGNDCHPDALTPHAAAQAEIDRLREDNERLRAERDQHLRARCEFGDIIANHCIAMQSALIEWYGSGTADSGMQWIENTLSGPGLLPDMKEASILGGAQAWFDKKMAEHEAFRAKNPPPARAALTAGKAPL